MRIGMNESLLESQKSKVLLVIFFCYFEHRMYTRCEKENVWTAVE